MLLYVVLASLALANPFKSADMTGCPRHLVSIFEEDLVTSKDLEKTENVVPVKIEIPPDPKATEVTGREYELLCRVCMSEAGGKWGEPLDGKVAVVETILNRVDMGMGTIEEVVKAPYQYSMVDNGEPDETVETAVNMALSKRMYPETMIYFRMDRYHSYGEPYAKIGNHYFSLAEEE